MNLNAFQDDIYIAYLIRRLFQLSAQRKALGHWMDAISRGDTVDSTLSLCVRSLATSFYGRVHRQPAISAWKRFRPDGSLPEAGTLRFGDDAGTGGTG